MNLDIHGYKKKKIPTKDLSLNICSRKYNFCSRIVCLAFKFRSDLISISWFSD